MVIFIVLIVHQAVVCLCLPLDVSVTAEVYNIAALLTGNYRAVACFSGAVVQPLINFIVYGALVGVLALGAAVIVAELCEVVLGGILVEISQQLFCSVLGVVCAVAVLRGKEGDICVVFQKVGIAVLARKTQILSILCGKQHINGDAVTVVVLNGLGVVCLSFLAERPGVKVAFAAAGIAGLFAALHKRVDVNVVLFKRFVVHAGILDGSQPAFNIYAEGVCVRSSRKLCRGCLKSRIFLLALCLCRSLFLVGCVLRKLFSLCGKGVGQPVDFKEFRSIFAVISVPVAFLVLVLLCHVLGVVSGKLAELKTFAEHFFVNAVAVNAGKIKVKAYIVGLGIGLHGVDYFVDLIKLLVGKLKALGAGCLAQNKHLLSVALGAAHKVIVPCAVAAGHLLIFQTLCGVQPHRGQGRAVA